MVDRRNLARLLCYGAKPSNEVGKSLESKGYSKGFIQGITLLLNGTRPVNTFVLDSKVNSVNAIKLEVDAGEWVLDFGSERVNATLPKKMAVMEQKYNGVPIFDFIQFHSPDTLFVTTIRECIFAKMGNVCKFCTYEDDKIHMVAPDTVRTWIEKIYMERGNEFDVALGCGTPNLYDHGVRYNAELAWAVREVVKAGVSVEIVPPNNVEDLQLLERAGVGSLVMSLEIWNDRIRKKLCPGKGVVSKEHYFEAWRRGVELFGEGQVSSVFIVGLEPDESLKEGIVFAIENGVVPTLIPFRPYDGIKLKDKEVVDHTRYLDISEFCVEALINRGIGPWLQRGCSRCGGCSLEVEGATSAP